MNLGFTNVYQKHNIYYILVYGALSGFLSWSLIYWYPYFIENENIFFYLSSMPLLTHQLLYEVFLFSFFQLFLGIIYSDLYNNKSRLVNFIENLFLSLVISAFIGLVSVLINNKFSSLSISEIAIERAPK